MSKIKSREIRLKNRPMGLVNEDDFELAEVLIPEIEEGQILVRNDFISVDPYMRGRMGERETYIAPFELGKPLDGACVGRVIQSKSENFQEGDFVLGNKGWREFFMTESQGLLPIDPEAAPIQNYLGILGTPGFTAYVGLLDIGKPKEGDTVFVSAAAGAVGSLVCQIAKINGCRVIGSTGSDAKVAWLLQEVGIDAAFNYKATENLFDELQKQCPEGIDIYFDNVGGAQLEAAIDSMNNHGRIVLCGMISIYNATRPPRAPRNLVSAISKRLIFQGFIVYDHNDRLPQFLEDMGQWRKQGQIHWRETIVHGLENAPKAFLSLFSGDNFGKMLVKL